MRDIEPWPALIVGFIVCVVIFGLAINDAGLPDSGAEWDSRKQEIVEKYLDERIR